MAAPVKIKTLETELEAAKKCIATEGSKAALVGKALRKKEKSLSHLQQEVEQLKGSKEALENQLSEATKKGLSAKKLERKLEELKEQMRARETELMSETEVQRQEIRELNEELAGCRAAKENDTRHHDEEVEKLKLKLTKASSETTKKKKVIATLKQANEELQESMKQLNDKIACSSGSSEMMEKKMQLMATKINTANDEIAELKNTNKSLKEQLAADSNRHSETIRNLNAEVERLQRVETELDDARSMNKVLEEQLKAASAKITENKALIERLNDEQEVLSRTNEEQQSELDKLNQLSETTAEIVAEARRLGEQVKELKKETKAKNKKIEQLEKNAEHDKELIEKLGEEKAERDAMIKDMAATAATVKTRDEDELAERIERARSVMSVESPRFTAPPSELVFVDATVETPGQGSVPRSCTPMREVVREKTPLNIRTPCAGTPKMKNMGHVTVSERRIERPEVNDDNYVNMSALTPKGNTAPCLYAQTPSKQDKENYKAALDEQVAIKRAKEGNKRKVEQCGDFFKFGAAGSGAPIRNSQNEVVTNVTFTRSTNYLPVDHPMSAKKKKTRHF
eukprot:TRINITY_DN29306_c0_g1_i1.p1 TRINITY_DN29306_c0_g1~~TRINITY_DN29306_c0_g1_i1.p1  ORF type:complete len:619 (+),score=309.47 TRINITY_DN29306_c0_g1_i1:143-1858(+)